MKAVKVNQKSQVELQIQVITVRRFISSRFSLTELLHGCHSSLVSPPLQLPVVISDLLFILLGKSPSCVSVLSLPKLKVLQPSHTISFNVCRPERRFPLKKFENFELLIFSEMKERKRQKVWINHFMAIL